MREAPYRRASWLAALVVLVGTPTGASAEQVLFTATDVAREAFLNVFGDIPQAAMMRVSFRS